MEERDKNKDHKAAGNVWLCGTKEQVGGETKAHWSTGW